MSTLPPVPFEGHIKNLLDWLRPNVPNIDELPLRFFEHGDVVWEGGRKILGAKLRSTDSMRARFESLSQEGREWINLAGDGLTPQGEYLISIEYSQSVGHPATYINLAGPPLNSDGSVRHYSDVKIVKQPPN